MAARESPEAPANAAVREALPAESLKRVSLFDPELRSVLTLDPIAQAIQGSWRNREKHGRIAYNRMMAQTDVSGPFRTLLHIIKSIRVSFQAQQQDPTPTQRDMADFLNAQLRRLAWTKLVDGFFGQGYQYGFSLAEMSTAIELWNDRPFVQVTGIAALPQASLDDGTSLAEMQHATTTDLFPSAYTCFDFDALGRGVIGYWQYRRQANDPNATGWTTTSERARILHFTHAAGDGDPYGESILYPAFDDWADGYLLKRQEQRFLENALPYLTASYKGDDPKPALHEMIQTYISEQDPTRRLLAGNNVEFGKVSASDPDYANHLAMKKKELRDGITMALSMPNSVYRETGEKDMDTRNLVQVFLKFVLPSLLDEIGEVMTMQFGKRLIDANYSNVQTEDYPRFRWRFVTPNDVRLVQAFLQMILPHLDSEKLGEVFAEYMPSFDAEYVAKDPKQSVGIVRQATITAAGAASQQTPGGAPGGGDKTGSRNQRTDGQTENAGQAVGTSA